ncbi:MAG: HAMP domain-containing protein, partial [Deltaproteobacteria bacterium]|nr:HAMP domain-containing protein [Deltaproteobacteria bacterium]
MLKSLRPKSVRLRLTLWYTLALTCVLLVYATGLYLLQRHSLFEELDRKLRTDVETTQEVIENWAHTDSGSFPEGLKSSQWLVEVWNAQGKLVYSSAGVSAAQGIPIPSDCDSKSIRSSNEKRGDGLNVRAGCKTFGANERKFTIHAERSAERIDSELNELILLMLAGLPVAVGIAGIGGYTLARRALSPVTRMADEAKKITADNLSGRLPVEDEHDELGNLAQTFNSTFARLERSFNQMKRFTADASHELRTPLTAIRTVGEVALRETRSPEQYREVVSSLLEESDRLRQLVDTLLTLSRADSGQLKINPVEQKLSVVVKEVVQHLSVLAEEKRQSLVVELGSDVSAKIDGPILRQAIINLIDNAIKHSPENSAIRVSVGKRENHPVIEVFDNGPGIAAEHRKKIFERFYRVDKARTRDLGGA